MVHQKKDWALIVLCENGSLWVYQGDLKVSWNPALAILLNVVHSDVIGLSKRRESGKRFALIALQYPILSEWIALAVDQPMDRIKPQMVMIIYRALYLKI
jgi:hypothetical protein